jgi:hypothetical protein
VGLGTIVRGPTIVQPVSCDGWEACEECSELIEAGDWPALARHTLRSFNLDLTHAEPGFRVRLLAQIHVSQAASKRARSGPREAA